MEYNLDCIGGFILQKYEIKGRNERLSFF